MLSIFILADIVHDNLILFNALFFRNRNLLFQCYYFFLQFSLCRIELACDILTHNSFIIDFSFEFFAFDRHRLHFLLS